VPPFVLTVLKIVFLALLYFFVYRAIRAVVVDIRASRGRGASEGHRSPQPSAPPRSARSRRPRSLVVMDERGGKTGTYRLDGNLQIGRADACQIQLSDTYVSQFHARIFSRDGSWFVEDLGSTNGTYLNQRRVTSPAELQAGDRLKVGKVVMEVRK
jgi:FHA domain